MYQGNKAVVVVRRLASLVCLHASRVEPNRPRHCHDDCPLATCTNFAFRLPSTLLHNPHTSAHSCVLLYASTQTTAHNYLQKKPNDNAAMTGMTTNDAFMTSLVCVSDCMYTTMTCMTRFLGGLRMHTPAHADEAFAKKRCHLRHLRAVVKESRFEHVTNASFSVTMCHSSENTGVSAPSADRR